MDSEPAGTVSNPLSSESALSLLRSGDIEVVGRLLDASNASLYCRVQRNGLVATCIYKPRAGERPLWDFPTGTLSRREVAAYEISAALGWDIVPPTVWRTGPFGVGMVQLWIDVDESVDLVELVRSNRDELRRIAVFDVVINNADRKGGHVLPTTDGHLFGIDHGVAFSVEPKVRTLLWQWEGEPIPAETMTDLHHLKRSLSDGALAKTLRTLLAGDEIAATSQRVEQLLTAGVHPGPSSDWPAIPWPPF